MDWLPRGCESVWGRFKLPRYHFILKEPCVLTCLSVFTTCCMFPSRSVSLRVFQAPVCLVLSFFVLSASLCPSSLPSYCFSFSLSLSPSFPVFFCCLFPSLCVFVSVLLSEVWSRESYYERLWKVEVTTLLC